MSKNQPHPKKKAPSHTTNTPGVHARSLADDQDDRDRDVTERWPTLIAAFGTATEWALDVAGRLAQDFPEELAAIDRVRVFLRHRARGLPAHVRVEDVLFTFALLLGAIERDLGPLGDRPHSFRGTDAEARCAHACPFAWLADPDLHDPNN